MEKTLSIDGTRLTLETIEAFLVGDYQEYTLTPGSRRAVRHCRAFVEDILARETPVYGINTGFGKLATVHIDRSRLAELQLNLVRSHACGVGEALPEPVVRLAMLLRINSLARGHSGVRLELIEQYLALLVRGVVPWVPRKGSVGASGDLAPLSHMALVAIGEGRAYVRGKLMDGGKALKAVGLRPIALEAKEGLALINGTQIIQAIGLVTLLEARKLAKLADMTAAMTIEALRGTDKAFDARLAALRPHPGHALVAANIRTLMHGSQIRESHRDNDPRVQDAYSLRCIPQIHGAVRDALDFVTTVFTRELNAVTDNPLIFADDREIISGGNFHGQPLAMAMDALAIGIAELGAVSERRIESMVNPDLSHLPPFLVRESGLHSGMMIAQVTAAALASENKVLAHPASVDSIPTSANQEDHVSMGVHAALKAQTVVQNVRHIVEIELLCARYALEYHRPLKPGKLIHAAWQKLAAKIQPLVRDRVTYEDFERVRALVDDGAFEAVLDKLR